jgi:electron transfer flavoprotein beta subunit
MNLVVCLKQVPAVAELEWDKKTGGLKRDLAQGMMNPACRSALEAALRLKSEHGGMITVISMGPPQAEEILREALALGADSAVLLSDPDMAGADTLATSYTLAKAIKLVRRDFDLVLCGCYSADSETAQVGPQLAEELNVAGVAQVETIQVIAPKAKAGRPAIRLSRQADSFLETLELEPPGVLTVVSSGFTPRHVDLKGLQPAFGQRELIHLDTKKLGANPQAMGQSGSATKILKVYPSVIDKEGVVLKGSVKGAVQDLFQLIGPRLNGLIGQGYQADE